MKYSLLVLCVLAGTLLLSPVSTCGQLISRSTNGTSWKGTVDLVSEVYRVHFSPFCLDIEQDVILTASAGTSGAPSTSVNLQALELQGNFQLPSGSAVTGVLVWEGNTILRGKLKPKSSSLATYESLIERDTQKVLIGIYGPILIEWVKSSADYDTYRIAMSPVAWGENRKFRIRYLVPQKFVSSTLCLPFTTPFADVVTKKPTRCEVFLSGKNGVTKTILEKINGTRSVRTFPTNFFLNYVDGPFTFYHSGVTPPQMVKTTFDTGSYKGKYLLFQSSVPDTLLASAGLKPEIVFLWRWNNWSTFVTENSSGKTLSSFGVEAINEAKALRSAIEDISSGGATIGLVIDRGDSALAKTFKSGDRFSAELDSTKSFLDSVNENYILSQVSFAPVQEIPLNDAMIDSIHAHGARSFSRSMSTVVSLFSSNAKSTKHCILVTVGPKSVGSNNSKFYVEPSGISAVTFSGYGTDSWDPLGYWPGVPLRTILEEKRISGNVYSTSSYAEEISNRNAVYSFVIPAFKSGTIRVVVANATTTKNVDIETVTINGKPQYSNFSFAGHSLSAWTSAVTWAAADDFGTVLSEYIQNPIVYTKVNDSLTVKLFSGAISPNSCVYQLGNLGLVYGVVCNGLSLLALPKDSLKENEALAVSDSGLGFLAEDEIFRPIQSTVTTSNLKQRDGGEYFSVVKVNTHVCIQWNINTQENVQIGIYNAQGALITSWNVVGLSGIQKLFFVPHGAYFSGMYYCKFTINKKVVVRSFFLLK